MAHIIANISKKDLPAASVAEGIEMPCKRMKSDKNLVSERD